MLIDYKTCASLCAQSKLQIYHKCSVSSTYSNKTVMSTIFASFISQIAILLSFMKNVSSVFYGQSNFRERSQNQSACDYNLLIISP